MGNSTGQSTLLVMGISHHDTDVDQRAKLAWSIEKQRIILATIKGLTGVLECVVLVTCNRCECIIRASSTEAILAWWNALIEPLGLSFYVHRDLKAIHHLLKTSCGLDAKILGEPQILGQLKRAYQCARETHACHAALGVLMDQVMHHARQIRLSAALGDYVISLPVLCYREIVSFYDVSRPLHILCLGAGKVIQSQVRLLSDKLKARFSLVTREPDKVNAFASVYDMKVCSYQDMPTILAHVDVVISATSSQNILIHAEDVKTCNSCLFLDLAVPRDIDPGVDSLDGLTLRHMDDFSVALQGNQLKREHAANKALFMIGEACERLYHMWLMRVDNPKVRAFRAHVERSRENVCAWIKSALSHGEDVKIVLAQARVMFIKELRGSFQAFSIPEDLWVEDLSSEVYSIEDVHSVEMVLYQWSQKLLHKPTQWLKSQRLKDLSALCT